MRRAEAGLWRRSEVDVEGVGEHGILCQDPKGLEKTAGNQRFRTTAVGCVYRQPGSSGFLRVVNAFHRRPR